MNHSKYLTKTDSDREETIENLCAFPGMQSLKKVSPEYIVFDEFPEENPDITPSYFYNGTVLRYSDVKVNRKKSFFSWLSLLQESI